jgi:hypothetical protein
MTVETNEQHEVPSTSFFLDELAKMQEQNERRYNALSRRVALLEEDSSPGLFQDDNPMKPLMGIIMIGMVVQLVAPLIEVLVKKWSLSLSE